MPGINNDMNKPKVSVVIVNWNTRDMLRDCLESVFAQTQLIPIQVIVIDNGSADDSCAMVREQFTQVELIENSSNMGFAKAMNQGVEASSGEYVLMLNSDTLIRDGAIEKVVRFADNCPEAAIIGCRLLNPDGTFQESCFRFPNLLGLFFSTVYLSQVFKHNFIFNWDRYGFREWTVPTKVDCVEGSFMLIRRSVLENIGLLDTGYFMYGEETDLSYRVKMAGWEVVYYPVAEVFHVRGGSSKGWAGRAWAYQSCQRGVLLFLCKWHHPAVAYLGNLIITIFLIPRLVAWWLMDVVSSLFQRQGFSWRRIKQGTSFWFHVRAIFRPKLLHQKWSRDT
jgi:hypothetical protein